MASATRLDGSRSSFSRTPPMPLTMPPPGEKCGSWGSIPTISHTNLRLARERSGLPRREYSRLGCMAARQRTSGTVDAHRRHAAHLRRRIIPITSRLKSILEMRRLGPEGKEFGPAAYAFGNEVGERVKPMRELWGDAVEKAGLKGLQLRDLRHEAGSRFMEAGMPISYVSNMLGHTNLTTTSRYLNINARVASRNGKVRSRSSSRRIRCKFVARKRQIRTSQLATG